MRNLTEKTIDVTQIQGWEPSLSSRQCADFASQLFDLQQENRRLQRLVAELLLKNQQLRTGVVGQP